MLLLLGCS